MKRRAARVIEDHPILVEKAWCWRDDWATGHDSAYGLFSKFAKLNALSAKELAHLFISRTCGQRTAILRAPKVDLRNSDLFDTAELARIMRLNTQQMQSAFLLERLDNGRRKSSNLLRWCPRCAKDGFHSAVFQLEFVNVCPAHGQAIRIACGKCKARIPYKLQAETFSEPFCCPNCHADLAPALRNPRTGALRLREKETAWIRSLVDLFTFEDEIVPVKLELNRQRKINGLGEVAFAMPDWRRIESAYTGFVTHVIADLRRETEGQESLSFADITVSVKRGSQPSDILSQRKIKYKRAKLPERIDKSSVLKRGWDDRLRASYLVYSAVRRHLWRHVVCDHQRCITAAAQHLWWRMEGERTVSFCPVAEAFLRWRMHWEACGTPRYLFAPMRHDPLGIAAWMAGEAPICPAGWGWDAEQWVSDHVLARSCLGSFRDYLALAIENSEHQATVWQDRASTGRFFTYWAVAGRGTPSCPTRIYEQVNATYSLADVIGLETSDRTHRLAHLTSLAEVRR